LIRQCMVVFAASLFGSCIVIPQQQPPRGPDGGTSTSVAGVVLLPIPDKPFSADTRIDWTETLEDGTVVTKHLDGHLARDEEGRMYREGRTFAEDSGGESRLETIVLFDPVAKTHTVCVVATHHCRVMGYQPVTSFAPIPTGWFDNQTRYLSRENLGTNVIQGLDVVGTRETVTINSGVQGNNRPLVSTRDFWYSPDLETNLSVTRKDPKEGTQVIQLLNISRSDLPPEKFQIPVGYSIENDQQGAQTATSTSQTAH
jgi:hypothetical protein